MDVESAIAQPNEPVSLPALPSLTRKKIGGVSDCRNVCNEVPGLEAEVNPWIKSVSHVGRA